MIGEERLEVLALPPVDGEPFAPGERARVTVPKSRIVAFPAEAGDAHV